MKKIGLLFVLALIIIIISTIGTNFITSANTAQSSAAATDVEVHFIDVGQGDSILICDNSHYMLIDAGENDKGADVVNYLKNNGIKRLDYVIGTHPHSDHIGGLDNVISTFEIGNVIMPKISNNTNTYEDVLKAIKSKSLKITQPVVGTTYTLGVSSFTILAPSKTYDNNLNNNSVGIKLTYKNKSFVMCGDAETEEESDILKSGINITADVLKLGHHGSATSTSDDFLNAVNPKYAIISCGADNSYGHPHSETLQKLKAKLITAYRTDTNGTIVAKTNGETITFTTAKADTTANTVDSKTTNYILNTNTKKFHLPSCKSITNINSKNKMSYTGGRDYLIQNGYSPCKICNP